MIYGLEFYFVAFLTGCFPIHESRKAAGDGGVVGVNPFAQDMAMGEVGGFFRGTAEKILGGGGHRVFPRFEADAGSLAVLAKICARWIVRTLDFRWRRMPSMCIRQLGSVEVRNSAPVCSAFPALVSPIAPDIILNLIAKVPPKPQQSSL